MGGDRYFEDVTDSGHSMPGTARIPVRLSVIRLFLADNADRADNRVQPLLGAAFLLPVQFLLAQRGEQPLPSPGVPLRRPDGGRPAHRTVRARQDRGTDQPGRRTVMAQTGLDVGEEFRATAALWRSPRSSIRRVACVA